MLNLAAKQHVISVDEYLEGEMRSDVRHEYLAGEVYAMAGAEEKHNCISPNLAFHLRGASRGKACGMFIVVAEGVETEGQCTLLVEMGCNELQVFLFSKPIRAEELAWLALDSNRQDQVDFRPSLFMDTRQANLDSGG